MSDFSTTAFTDLLCNVKNSLDSFFCIPLKEDATEIIKRMETLNAEEHKRTAIADEQAKLIAILKNDDNYIEDHSIENPDGSLEVIPLMETFRDKADNSLKIATYREYVEKLKSVDELDQLFLEKLNVKYTEYKSSSDYISRTVKRLLSEFNKTNAQKNIYLYDLNESTRLLILKHFIRQFDWFEGITEINAKDVKTLVKEKYKNSYELIDDSIFEYCTNQRASWYKRQITEDFVDTVAKIQGIIKYKAPFIKMNSAVRKMIKCIIVEEKLVDKTKFKEADVLSECFNDFYYDVNLDWLKSPDEIGITEELCDVLCRVVKTDSLTSKAKTGEAKTLAECFKGRKIPLGTTAFKEFDEIEMTAKLCSDFYKILRKGTNESERRSQKAKNGTAKTLAECFATDNLNVHITSINSIIMYFYKLIYDEMDKQVENCTVKKSTYNDATKKGGDLYEKSRKKLNFFNYDLLKIVDDLANARFSNKGKTREYLYIFAIAFEMTSTGYNEDTWKLNSVTSTAEKKEDPRKKTDIQKNLFFDYYADNIVNNISKISGLGGQLSDETAIDGYGINYKNFAEIAFLWSINQKGSPTDKLKLAYEVIRHCKKNGYEKGAIRVIAEKNNKTALTQDYKNILPDFTELSQDGIQTFLINNYSCRSNRASIDINNSPETAKLICERYIKNDILKHYKEVTSFLFNQNILETQKISLLYDLLILDNQMMFDFYKKEYYLKKHRCNTCAKKKDASPLNCSVFSDECEQWYKDYICSLDIKEINDFESKVLDYLEEKLNDPDNKFNRSFYNLSSQCTNEQNGIKEVLQSAEKRIKSTLYVIENGKDFKASRTIMLSLCYIDYILLNWYERVLNKYRYTPDFSQFYEDFCNGKSFWYQKEPHNSNELIELQFKGANYYLQESGYQLVNSKNLFDISIIFMAYRDNYKQLFQYAGDELVSSYRTITEYDKRHKKEIEKNKKNKDNISKDR